MLWTQTSISVCSGDLYGNPIRMDPPASVAQLHRLTWTLFVLCLQDVCSVSVDPTTFVSTTLRRPVAYARSSRTAAWQRRPLLSSTEVSRIDGLHVPIMGRLRSSQSNTKFEVLSNVGTYYYEYHGLNTERTNPCPMKSRTYLEHAWIFLKSKNYVMSDIIKDTKHWRN